MTQDLHRSEAKRHQSLSNQTAPELIVQKVLTKESPESRLFLAHDCSLNKDSLINQLPEVSYAQDHNFSGHTMDDFLVVDRHNNIYIVADGVTRTKCENQNAAWQTAEAFGRLMHYHICEALAENLPATQILQHAFQQANLGAHSVNSLNQELGLGGNLISSPRGSCTAAVLLEVQQRLFIGTIGDCQVAVIDDSKDKLKLIKLTDPQTTLCEKIRNEMPNPIEFHRRMANKLDEWGKPDSIAYGVVNGDPNARHFFKVQEITEKGLIYLFSDGIPKLAAEIGEILCNYDSWRNTADQILTSALHKCRLTQGPNFKTDDSSLIKIRFAN